MSEASRFKVVLTINQYSEQRTSGPANARKCFWTMLASMLGAGEALGRKIDKAKAFCRACPRKDAFRRVSGEDRSSCRVHCVPSVTSLLFRQPIRN